MDSPSLKGGNGRDRTSGRFLPGWRGGPGNPHIKQTSRLRSELLQSIKPSDIKTIIRALLRKAKRGDVYAAREILDRTLGKPQQTIELDASVNSPPLYLDLADAVQALRRDSLADGDNGE